MIDWIRKSFRNRIFASVMLITLLPILLSNILLLSYQVRQTGRDQSLSAEEMLEGLEDFGQYAVLVFWAAGNVAFVLYDLCLDTIKMAYIKLLKPKLSIKLK